MDRRNIGILAHVDAGKTTLTERMLKTCAAIRELGAVDQGTAHTDRMDIERRRGISIRATCASMEWKGCRVQVIDTPGHADFSAEVERSLWALDGAILLLSAVDGVQPQAEVLFEALERAGIPCAVFINKADREGADVQRVLREARATLSPRIAALSDDELLHLAMAESDEETFQRYLEGDFYPRDALLERAATLSRKGLLYPALAGSALQGEGVEALLDAVLSFLPPPGGDAAGPLAGVVFSIESDRALGRAAHVRLFSGTLQNRDAPLAAEQKITQIRTIPLEGRGEDIGVLRAGEIGALYGLKDVKIGQILGQEGLIPRGVAMGQMSVPLLMASLTPEDPGKLHALRGALDALSAEDPLLSAVSYQGVPHVRVMGAVQLEVLGETLQSRFGLSAQFGPPSVVYRETIREPAVGFFAYTMPKPCWAVVKFWIEPLPRGTGIQYDSAVPARDILPRYQHQIEQALPMALRQGMLGWQVDDVRVTLVGGEHHLVHTHPLDFILATPVALMDGLHRGGTVLLEPILSLRIHAPEESAGRIISEIIAMRGNVMASSAEGGRLHLLAEVPMATSVSFSTRLAAITGGRGAMSVHLSGYRESEGTISCPREGVHPLDTAKYILAARNALGGGIFERG